MSRIVDTGHPGLTVGGHRILFSNGAPTSGYHYKGDRCFATDPDTGEASELVCTATGAPGTWTNASALWAPVWNDWAVPDQAMRPGVTAPTATTFKGNTRCYAYSKGDMIDFSIQLPHWWKEGTNIKPHLHMSVPSTNTGSFAFAIEYSLASVNAVFTNEAFCNGTLTNASGTAYKHVSYSVPEINMSGQTVSSILQGRLYRGPDGTLTDDIFVHSFDFHILQDAIGSTNETSK